MEAVSCAGTMLAEASDDQWGPFRRHQSVPGGGSGDLKSP